MQVPGLHPLPALVLVLGHCCPITAAGQLENTAPEGLVIVGKRPATAAGPATTTVLDAAELRARGTSSLEDLLAGIPGVQPNAGEPGQSLPTVRGIGTTTSSLLLGTQQATTGVYVDEVPLTSPFGFLATPDLTGFSLERVEILRGPQGSLFGAASLGGAVQYILGRPRRGQPKASTEFGLILPSTGDLGAWLQATMDPPLAEAAGAVRIEAYRRRTPGWVDNLGTGHADANAMLRQGARVAGRWWVEGGTVLGASLLQQRQQVDDTQAVSPYRDTLTISTPTASRQRNQFSLASVQIETPLSPHHLLRAVTGWVDQQVDQQNDLTRSRGALGRVYGPLFGLGPLPVLPQVQFVTQRPTRGRQLSQEVRVAADGGQGPHFQAGLFLQATHFDLDSASVATGGRALWGPAAFLLPDDQLGALKVQATTREAAVFGELQLQGPGGLGINLGGRVSRNALSYVATQRFLGLTTTAAPRQQERGFTPRLALEWPLGSRARSYSLHATMAGGYRMGGVNFNPPALSPYHSDRLMNHDLGLRLRPDENLHMDLTAFWIDWRDAQVSALQPGPVPLIGVANVGRARSRGLEAAWQWKGPGGWQLSGALAGTDARTRVAFTTDGGTQVPPGARLPGTPRWQTHLRVGREFQLREGWRGQASLSHAWVGSRVFDIEGSAAAPSYHRLDARLVLTRGPWEVAAQLDNLGDTRGVAGATVINRPGVAAYTDWFLITPRRLGLSTRYRF